MFKNMVSEEKSNKHSHALSTTCQKSKKNSLPYEFQSNMKVGTWG